MLFFKEKVNFGLFFLIFVLMLKGGESISPIFEVLKDKQFAVQLPPNSNIDEDLSKSLGLLKG
jgi:hypothetical protein